MGCAVGVGEGVGVAVDSGVAVFVAVAKRVGVEVGRTSIVVVSVGRTGVSAATSWLAVPCCLALQLVNMTPVKTTSTIIVTIDLRIAHDHSLTY